MGKEIDIIYLLKLIEASRLLVSEQKESLKDRLGDLSTSQLGELVIALENEQKAFTQYYRNLTQIRKEAAEKKVKIYYRVAEEKLEEREQLDLEQLDREIANF